MKPFNGMNGWGKVLSINIEKKKGKKYLTIKLGCEGVKYGNVKIFLNVWSDSKAIEYENDFNKGDFVKVRGFMGQYSGRRNQTRTSVYAFKIEPWDPENDEHSKNRMTFILVGRVVSFKDGRQEGQAEISTNDNYPPLKVYIPQQLAIDIIEGEFFRLKGAMMIEKDDHGVLMQPLRPLVEDVEQITETVAESSGDNADDDILF